MANLLYCLVFQSTNAKGNDVYYVSFFVSTFSVELRRVLVQNSLSRIFSKSDKSGGLSAPVAPPARTFFSIADFQPLSSRLQVSWVLQSIPRLDKKDYS